jgi:hypothetical protein
MLVWSGPILRILPLHTARRIPSLWPLFAAFLVSLLFSRVLAVPSSLSSLFFSRCSRVFVHFSVA